MEKELVWTNEDAIKMLKSKMYGSVDTSYEWVETVRLAINALEGKKKREMTNEDAIEILANARYADDLQGNEDLATAHYMAIEALKTQPKWIPVSERLPENEQRVLFCTKQGDIHQGTYYADSKWYSSIRSTWIYFDSILAWMPLPEPYKAKSEE